MRITGVKTFVANVQRTNFVFVKLYTDEGIDGVKALSKKAVDILQPDVSHAGGLAETKRVAHLAHLHLIPVAPHNPVGPVMNAMTLHTAVAVPILSIFETVSVDVPW